jgi:hypothetical protein
MIGRLAAQKSANFSYNTFQLASPLQQVWRKHIVCDNRTGSSLLRRSLQPQSVHYPGSTVLKLAWHGHQAPREVCAQHGRCRIENTGCSAVADSI